MLKFIKSFLYEYKEYFILIFLLLISLSVLSLNQNPGAQKVKSYAFATFAFMSSGIEAVKSVFVDEDELSEMRRLNARLMMEVNKLREYALENRELRKMMSLKDTIQYPLIAAKVISKSVSKLQSSFIINVGSKDSISVGMPVINHEGLIGLISETSDQYAVVRILKNQNLRIAVEIQRNGIHGILAWNGENLIIKNIAATTDIEIGDRVTTSSFSTIVPPSIPVGIVSETNANSSDVLSKVRIKPFADFSNMDNLFVIKIIEDKKIGEFSTNLLKEN